MSLTLLLLALVSCSVGHKQIRLSLGKTADTMTIMWISSSRVTQPMVQYGLSPNTLDSTVVAQNTTTYTVGSYTSGYIHTAVLNSLQLTRTYYYRVGDSSGVWTNVHSFSTDQRYPVRFLAIADWGTQPYCTGCGDVLAAMLEEHSQEPVDFLLHSGDISYANGNQDIWDEYGEQIQPITETIPYMVAVGNHENHDEWTAFTHRFNMHAQRGNVGGNFFYSFDFGPIHMIILDSEATSFGPDQAQYQWLVKDLASIDRSKTPWVFAAWHRVWYSSNLAHPGSGEAMRVAFEDLLYKYKVDIMFVGHTHACERTVPMYKGNPVPDGIVTLMNGNGGDHVGSDKKWVQPQPAWSKYRTTNFGFGAISIYNSTHLRWEMHDVVSGKVTDDWWFVRDHMF